MNKAFIGESHILKLDTRRHVRQSYRTRDAQATKRLKIRLRSWGVERYCSVTNYHKFNNSLKRAVLSQ